MNAAVLPAIATLHEGGYYVGRYRIGTRPYALIVAPKAEGEHDPIVWNRSQKMIESAQSYCDGLANTRAMAEAGSALAKWALEARIGGFDDWYIGAVDENELLYRHLKPGTEKNSCWARSGINLSAEPPTWPHTPAEPAQTSIALFQQGGSEAFEQEVYWTSTQHASISDCAWGQYFSYGRQGYWFKDNKFRARVVRRLAL
jgi:hypothetical protein